nr:hypothetical protein [Kofleriaceae bacterium]
MSGLVACLAAALAAGCAAPAAATMADAPSAADAGGDGRGATDGAIAPTGDGSRTGCAAGIQPGEERTCAITIAGVAREYLVYAPASYDASTPAALVVDAHGSSETDHQQAGTAAFLVWPTGLGSGWRLVADTAGFVVVEPQGIGDAWSETDTAFVLALPAELAAAVAIDPARVYLSGISNGGGLTYWTGCADAGTFRGFAPVSGYADATCPVTHAAPILHFATPGDKLVPYAQGQAAMSLWTTAHHCDATPVASWQFGGAATDPRPLCLTSAAPWALQACRASDPVTTCQRWTGCDGGADTMFCTVPPDNSFDGGTTGGHILYFNATHLALAAVAWAMFSEP